MGPLIKRISTAVLAAAAALLVAGGLTASLGGAGTVSAQEAPPTATAATTGNIPVIAINQELCFLLIASRGGINPTIGAIGCPGLQNQFSLDMVAGALIGTGTSNAHPQPADFAAIDLDGNQVHQQDGYAQVGVTGSPGSLYIIAFVSTTGPVQFHTDRGVFVQNAGGDPAAADWTCDTALEDPDCVAGGAGGDGVVVARLRANDAIASVSTGATLTPATVIAPTGDGTVTITQSPTDTATIGFKVVGEPHALSFVTLENKLQDASTGATTQCPLPFDADGDLTANAQPEKSAVFAVAKDIDGTAVTGALVNWNTSDINVGVLAAPLTPTLDRGTFGVAAPNMLCGTASPGTVTVTGALTRDVSAGATIIRAIDPGAELATGTVDFTVVGVPASITLTADPATVACDGTTPVKISATVMDAAGNTSAAGQQVHFDTQTLGSADPVDATTDGNGAATSEITPLSGLADGVTVVVTAGDAANSVLISCAAPESGKPPPSHFHPHEPGPWRQWHEGWGHWRV
jgi:hypothetical protein